MTTLLFTDKDDTEMSAYFNKNCKAIIKIENKDFFGFFEFDDANEIGHSISVLEEIKTSL